MQMDQYATQQRPELSTADSDDKLHTGSQQVAAGMIKRVEILST